MIWSASVLTTASSDTEPTIVFTFDSGKYVFDAGENAGRAWLQSKRHWRKARGLFLTSVGTQTCSGLPGLLMHFADAAVNAVEVVGPYGLTHYLASMRTYLLRQSMGLSTREVPSDLLVSADSKPTAPEPVYADENIKLYAIPIHAASVHKAVSMPGKRKRSPSPDSSSKRPARSPSPFLNVPLLQRLRHPQFSTAQLRGAEAQEWRRLMLENMFAQKKRELSPDEIAAAKKQARAERKERKKLEESESPTQSQRPPIVAHNKAHEYRDWRLPPFEYPNGDPTRKATLCYILMGPRARGKFDAKNADELGVKGKLRSRLTKGETVTFMVDDGKGNQIERIVRPEDCVGPSEIPKVGVVLHVPTPDHIPELVASFTQIPFFAQFRSKAEKDLNEHSVHVVFHNCGPGVLEDERYKAFMRGFSDETYHLVSSREHNADPVTFTSVAYGQVRLNQLDPDMFPIQKFNPQPRRDLSSISGLPPRVELLQANRLVDFRPAREPCHDTLAQTYDPFHPIMAHKNGVTLPPKIAERFAEAQAKVKRLAVNTQPRPGDNVEVIPLGTSSALPTKYRNVSSTLIRIPGWGSLLLDAGEGTWGQLVRLYGDDIGSRTTGVWEVLRDLKCIFASHIHGDHHMGIAKILAMRKLMNPPATEPLYVVGIRQHLVYLREQSEVEGLGIDQDSGNGVLTILADVLNWRPAYPYNSYGKDHEPHMDEELSRQHAQKMCQALGLESFTTVDVFHRTRCYGVVIKHQSGWSVVFSADTAPTGNLVKAGSNATLLIHEASMADDQEEMAWMKAHSTCGQAIDIGRQMNAKNILLTHFSARYPKMPRVIPNPSQGSRRQTLALAFDHTRVRIGDMWKLNAYLPAIERNFAETVAEIGDEEEEQTATFSW